MISNYIGCDDCQLCINCVYLEGEVGKWVVMYYEVIECLYYVIFVKC